MIEERSAGYWMFAPLRKYAVFSGRARRAEYWWFYLFYLLVNVGAAVVDFLTKTPFAGGLAGLVFVLPLLAVGARRLHDVNRSGWWMYSPVLALVPFGLALAVGGGGFKGNTGAIVLLGLAGLTLFGLGLLVFVWNCTQGTGGPNRFGDDPMRPDDVSEVFA